MILGISSFAFGWSIGIEGNMPAHPINEADLVNYTLHSGLGCLQIGDNLPLHLLSPERLATLKALITKHNIRLELGARKLTADHLNHYIKLAAYFQSPLLRFVIDGDQYEPSLNTVTGIIRELLPVLSTHNLTLGIENHDRFKAVDLATMIESIGHDRVGICLDCINSLGAGEGFDWVSDVLAPHTVNLHIKDVAIRRMAHKMGFIVTGAPAGAGMINVPQLIEKLSRYNRCQSAVLEQWVEPEARIDDTVKKEHEWATRGIHYLMQLPQLNRRASEI